jgi:hypothetical protein
MKEECLMQASLVSVRVTMYEANGPRGPQFQQQIVYGYGVLGHRKSL